MPGYIVTGRLGAGKGKWGVGRMQACVRRGARIATNFDLWMEHLAGPKSRATAIRVPDHPTAADLYALGRGHDGAKPLDGPFGELHLDECASWLNSRQHADKARAALVEWFVHARKLRWDVYFYVQDLDAIDKQLRKMIAQFHVKCINLQGFKLPVVGQFLGKKGKLPRLHVAHTYSLDLPGLSIDADYYRLDDLNDAYDTEQIFRAWARDPGSELFATERYAGPHSMLSGWHVKGRMDEARTARVVKPKLPQVQLMERLSPDERMQLAARYWRIAA